MNNINYEIYKNDHFEDKVNLYPMSDSDSNAYWILDLRNSVHHTCFDDRVIGWDEHIKYWNKNFFFYLMIGNYWGYVKIKDNVFSIVLEPEFRRKGIGRFVVEKVLRYYPNIVAEIKPDSVASIKFFESCNFKLRKYVYVR